MHIKEMILQAVSTAIKAGETIMEVYGESDPEITEKPDHSPLTLADRKSNTLITTLLHPTGMPILSEEGIHFPYSQRKKWEYYWLVDPLDGTKEFISRNGEFTVNIALILRKQPVLGVIYVPVIKQMYFGSNETGAWKAIGIDHQNYSVNDFDSLLKRCTKLPTGKKPEVYTIVASRSHINEETRSYIDNLKKNAYDTKLISKGSSLKFCMIAEGSAHIYPRFGPTMEWDTAAGHAIVLAAGGKVTLENGQTPLEYNKEDLRNPNFIVSSPFN